VDNLLLYAIAGNTKKQIDQSANGGDPAYDKNGEEGRAKRGWRSSPNSLPTLMLSLMIR
jgi:hypothetical protein